MVVNKIIDLHNSNQFKNYPQIC